MASTYSPNLAIELIGTGDQAGTWSVTTNTNLGTLIEQSISGYVTQAITDGSGANTTITIPNGATGVARNMVIEMTGALTFSTTSLIVPANKKLYFIFNNTTGGFAVTVKVSGQTGVSVPNGKKVVLVSNGTDIVVATNYMASLELGAALPVASGGTSLATLTANNVILGAGTSAPTFVAPSTSGNVLTSNGTTWTSALPVSGGVTTFAGGTTGLTPAGATSGAITLAGTLAVANGGTGNATGTATINANLTGDITSVGNATTLTNAPVIAKVLTGYTSGAGTVAATDSILQAIQKLNGNNATNANLTGPITSVGNATSITAGAIVNADINASAGIVDTKLATISTASKVSNSATTAASANTASAIVARDASGNFTAGTITAALTGTASGNLVSGGALGTPSSGTLTNCTFPTLNQNTTGTASNVTGTVAVANGGTGLTTTPANGALNIGNGTGFTRATLTAGSNITITNGAGSISIAGNAGTVTSVTGTSPVVSSGGTTPAISMGAASSAVNGYMTGVYATKLDGIATGATANTGTVTSVSGTGTVSGLTLSGTVTTSGSLTLGGAIGTLNQNTTGSSGSCTGNAATATTATNQSGGTVSATTGTFSSTLGVTGRSTLTAGFQGTVQRGSYGSISLYGSAGGYQGIDLNDQSVTWMTNIAGGVSFGAYKNNSTWAFYFDASGVLQAGSVPGGSVTGTVSSATSAASCTGNSATATALSTASGSAPSYSARAWVNFDGTGTVAIRASGNVSSITDNGTGDYTVNFSTAMSDANYAAMGCAQYNQDGGGPPAVWIQLSRNAQTSSAVRFQCSIYEGTLFDMTTVTVAVFR